MLELGDSAESKFDSIHVTSTLKAEMSNGSTGQLQLATFVRHRLSNASHGDSASHRHIAELRPRSSQLVDVLLDACS